VTSTTAGIDTPRDRALPYGALVLGLTALVVILFVISVAVG